MFISIVSKNGKRVPQQKWDSYLDVIRGSAGKNILFDNPEQSNRFWDWAWETIPYTEAKARVEKLGYEVWEGDAEFGCEVPETICRFAIWRRVDKEIRKPEVIEFEGMKLGIRVS